MMHLFYWFNIIKQPGELMQKAILQRDFTCKTAPAIPVGGCIILPHDASAGKKMGLIYLQVQTQFMGRGLAFSCIVPSSGLADQVVTNS